MVLTALQKMKIASNQDKLRHHIVSNLFTIGRMTVYFFKNNGIAVLIVFLIRHYHLAKV